MHEIAGFIKTNTQYFGVSSPMSDVCFQFTTYVKKQNKKKQPFQLNRKYVCLKCKKKKEKPRWCSNTVAWWRCPCCCLSAFKTPQSQCSPHQKRSRPWEKNAWNVCKAYVNFTSPGEESVVTMKGHRGENNVITCYPDTKAPLNTFPQH